MSINYVELPFEYFPSFTKGRPIFGGSLYVGEPSTDPKVEANQKQIYIQEAFINGLDPVEVAQPLELSNGGVPEYAGNPVVVTVDGDYSIRVDDKNGEQIYYFPSVRSGTPITPDSINEYIQEYNNEFLGNYTSYEFDTVSNAQNGITIGGETVTLKDGDVIRIKERASALFDVTSSLINTPNGYNIIGHDTLALSFVLRLDRFHVDEWGALGDGFTDDHPVIQAIIDYLTVDTNLGGKVNFGKGKYRTTSTITDNGKTILLVGEGVNFNDETSGECTTIFVDNEIDGYNNTGNKSGATNIMFVGNYDYDNEDSTNDTIALVKSDSSQAYFENIVCRDYIGRGMWMSAGNVSNVFSFGSVRTGAEGFVVYDEEGSPIDVNGSGFYGINVRQSKAQGIRVINGFGIFFYQPRVEGCGGIGIDIESDQNHFIGVYTENNDSDGGNYDIRFASGAARNKVYSYYTAAINTSLSVLDESSSQDNSVDSVKAYFDNRVVIRELQVLRQAAGVPGHVLLAENDTTNHFDLTLEGTEADQEMNIYSSGAGRFNWYFQNRVGLMESFDPLNGYFFEVDPGGTGDLRIYKMESDAPSEILRYDLDTGAWRMANMPTSSAGLSIDSMWNDGGTVKIT